LRFVQTIHLLPVLDSIFSLFVAFVLGTLIGVERQLRQRSAGLRTNTLVAIGAAAFVDIAQRLAGDAEAVRVISYVVSGIGFLGAGVIMKDGMNVRGLNTAATLWCSAAVGVGCGAGFFALAALVAGLIVVVNIVVRPLVAAIDRSPRSGAEVERVFCITATGAAEREAALRLLLVKQIAASEARLRRLDSEDLPCPEGGTARIALTAHVVVGGAAEERLEAIIGRLSLEPAVTRAGWAEVGE